MATPSHESATLRLLIEMETLRRLVRLYPPNHPALPTARLRVTRAAEALAVPALSLAFGPDAIFLDQQEITVPRESPAVRLRQLLCRLGLAAIHLAFPDALRGLPDFVEQLAALHDPPGEDDRETLLDHATSFPGIELVPLDLAQVQLVDTEREDTRGLPVWAELARRLGQDGAFVLADQILNGELTPQLLAELVGASADPATLFEQIFKRLAELLHDLEAPRRRTALRELARFVDEWLRLLSPERRHLAVVAAASHFPPPIDPAAEGEPLVALEALLDAVEYLLGERLPVPEVVVRAVARLAAMGPNEELGIGEAVVARCRAIQVRISLLAATPAAEALEPPRVPTPVQASPAEGLRETMNALTDQQVRLDLARVLGEAVTLWGDDVVAERASVRLAEELVAGLEVGDLTAAARIVTLLSATRFPEARKMACEAGVAAAVRAFASIEKSEHNRIAAILVGLGENAIPALLEALANEENMSIRKRLLEAVLYHGEGAVPYLRARLDDPRWYVVRNAIFLLRRLGDRASARPLRAQLANARPQVAAEILKFLVSVEDPHWLEVLLQELQHPDVDRRLAALSVAARIRHPAVVEALAAELDRRRGKKLLEPYTLELIRALGRLGDPLAVTALARILKMRGWLLGAALSPLRREAARALAHMDAPEARALLAALATDRDEGVARAARTVPQAAMPEEELP